MRRMCAVTLAVAMLFAFPAGAGADGSGALREADLSGRGFDSGDPNGTGHASLRIRPIDGKICFRITHRRIVDPNYGGIYSGPIDSYGVLEVTLFNGDRGMRPSPIEGCARNLERRLLRKIKRHPRRFYVQIDQHTFANSAVRGTLKRP